MDNKNTSLAPKGKIIRDAVHGDIFIPDKFINVIDTPEFQRLRRIKQLSVANCAFPSADHSRFSHSIGTFYIMNLIISHFEEKFNENDIPISREDKDIVLLAALLHDIGHGPFSHAFEDIHPSHKNKNHEKWTTEIITEKESTIRNVIEQNFGKDIPDKTAELIEKQRQIKKDGVAEIDIIDLFSVLSSMISSQLDADRLDYLLRDSMNCGVSFGNVDISRVISSLNITVYKNRYFVYVPEKYLQDIESYLLARYQMQKAVYYHDFKIEIEQIIKQIFRRAYDLYNMDSLEFCPPILKKLFLYDSFKVSDYIKIDDSTFIYAFQEWAQSKDEILSKLCLCFLNRNKSKKINALNNSDSELLKFKAEVCTLFSKYNYHITDFKNEYFWIEDKRGFSAYKKQKENIWIMKNDGTLVDITEISKIIKCSDNNEIVWQDNKNLIYINFTILRAMKINNIQNLIEDLNLIISNYNIRNTIEIEKKYFFENSDVFKNINNYFEKQSKYKIEREDIKKQIDIYYDTVNFDLRSSNSTLRIRQIDNNYEVTIKRPAMVETENDDQNIRFEFQEKIDSDDITKASSFINDHLAINKSNIDIKDLKRVLLIENNRTPIQLTHKNIIFEMVYDRIIYKDLLGKQKEDFQVEIELKSDYSHRVNLKILTDEIEKEVNGLTSTQISKYQRGLYLLR